MMYEDIYVLDELEGAYTDIFKDTFVYNLTVKSDEQYDNLYKLCDMPR